MRISTSLLKNFLKLSLPASEIAEKLTLLGIEVDGILDEEGENPIFELSLTPNLGHCLSALGIARELAAGLNLQMHVKTPHVEESAKNSVHASVEKGCPRYLLRTMENVEVRPSPDWIQRELKAAGMSPINNIVDATNYALLKWGQPLHAFDLDKLEGKKLQVKETKEDISFLGLDGISREVPKGTLMIFDAKKPAAIAGILGGEESAVSEATRNIVIEAAFFNPMTVRIASKKLGLRTESAIRFEKGVDPHGIERALDEACHIIQESCKGAKISSLVDLTEEKFPPKKIALRTARVNQLLGTHLSLTEMEEFLKRLGFAVKVKDETLHVEVPAYRFDITAEIDLVEEIARIYGYNYIRKKEALAVLSNAPHDPLFLFQREMREKFRGLGLQEFITANLISPKLAESALEIVSRDTALLKTLHAKTEEYSILRPSLLPGLLQVVRGNLDQKNFSIGAFEIGQIHFRSQEKIVEFPVAAVVLTGRKTPLHFSEKGDDFDFFDLKGILENLFEGMKIPPVAFVPSQHISFHPTRQADLLLQGERIGSIGEVHPSLLSKFDIKQKVLFGEMQIPALLRSQKKEVRMKPLSEYPSSERDLTLTLPKEALIGPLLDKIKTYPLPLLEKAELIDLYAPLDKETKNVTFRFTYRDPSKTVSFEEVEKTHGELLNLLAK